MEAAEGHGCGQRYTWKIGYQRNISLARKICGTGGGAHREADTYLRRVSIRCRDQRAAAYDRLKMQKASGEGSTILQSSFDYGRDPAVKSRYAKGAGQGISLDSFQFDG